MKKFVKSLLVLALAGLMMLSMVSCGDKSGSIKKAFEKEGFTVTTVDATNSTAKGLLTILLSQEQMEKAAEYEIILCTKEGILNVGATAAIIKFPSAGELKDFLTVENSDGKKDTSAYDKAIENGTINGNCMIFTASSSSNDIFKNA